MGQSIFSHNVLLQTVAQSSLHLRSLLVPLPPLPHNYRIGKEIYGRYSIYALGIVFEVGRDPIRTIADTALWCALRFKKGVGAPMVVYYEPELDHQSHPSSQLSIMHGSGINRPSRKHWQQHTII